MHKNCTNVADQGWTPDSPLGQYRRKVMICADGYSASAAVEDDAHRFGISLLHDGRILTAVEADAIRYPFTTCPSAGAALQTFIGTMIDRDVTAPARRLRASLCCTHQFDLVALAIAQCARGKGSRVYEAAAKVEGSRRSVRLTRDAAPCLDWVVDDYKIRSSDAANGLDVRSVLATLSSSESEDFIEAIFVARRALRVSPDRLISPLARKQPSDMMGKMAGACHSFQPEVALHGRYIPANFRDFNDAPEALLANWPSSASAKKPK
jgi:hypothetical protein